MHIPSGVPLVYESVMDAYKKAYTFFPKTHGDFIEFTCYSYLLLPKYQRVVFKERSNIYNYAKDFCTTAVAYEEVFRDGWRIFGPDFSTDVSKPLETHHFREHLLNILKRAEKGTVSVFLEKLENLPELSKEELIELSARVKKVKIK